MQKEQTQNIAFISLATAFIAVLAFFPPVPIPFIPVPIVLQNLAIMLTALLLPLKKATLSIGLFLILVALGLPFLSGGKGGLSVFYGPTAMYLLSWLLSPLFLYLCRHGKQEIKKPFSVILSAWLALVLFPNMVGALGIAHFTQLSYWKAFLSTGMFILGDTLKVLLALLIVNRLPQRIKGKIKNR